jgi:hypothetical protein
MSQQPIYKTSNWVIIPKNELREIASRETSVQTLVEKIEATGNANPDGFNYITVPDGEIHADGAYAFATSNSADAEIGSTLFKHIQRHPKRKNLTLAQADELHTRLFTNVQESMLAMARAHAKQQAEKAMNNENNNKIPADIRAGNSPEELNSEESDCVIRLLEAAETKAREIGANACQLYLEGRLKALIPDNEDLCAYETYPETKKAHARRQVIRMLSWEALYSPPPAVRKAA